MSKCGLDECDLYGGCAYDCVYGKEQKRLNKTIIQEMFRAKAAKSQAKLNKQAQLELKE